MSGRLLLGLSAAAVVVVGIAVMTQLGASGAGGPTSEHRHRDQPRPETVRTVEAAPAKQVGAVPPEPPRSAVLPDGVRVPVVPATTREDGVLDVPEDIRTAGWWQDGSRLGDPFGSTLIAAHVDSRTQGLGPYVSLLSVRPGQRVVVHSEHLRQTFRVVSLRLVPQGSLANESWIYSPAGRRRLTLVTCAPPYERARGGYQNLAVVTSTPIGPPRSRS